jgi:hypothetical protein
MAEEESTWCRFLPVENRVDTIQDIEINLPVLDWIAEGLEMKPADIRYDLLNSR